MSNDRRMLIIGSGPSTRELADLGFENLRSNVDTFGMGIEYRFFQRINWWPTLYACGDTKVVFSHREALAEVVKDPEVSTERFYFSWAICEHPRFELIDHGSTGDFCLRKTLELGYKEIYLIGIEGQYVEEILESRPLSKEEHIELGYEQLGLSERHTRTLRIITVTPESNPNYFFRGYQQAGDVYSLPQSSKHRERWSDAAAFADASGAKVLNLGVTSRILDFPKAPLANLCHELLDHRVFTPRDRARSGAAHSAIWYGPFEREQNKRIDESAVVFELFQSLSCRPANRKPVMVDVGACRGGAFRRFAEAGWEVHAFEPNPPLFEDLCGRFHRPNVKLNVSAVSDVEGEEIPFYTSEESLGISSLKPFRETHKLAAHVKTVTLNGYLREQGIHAIDFLKSDAEGTDLMVLKGLDLAQHTSEVILCEFEDQKTRPLGYSIQDLADHLQSFGYTVYVSEWHPVVRYGVRHQWRALKLYPCELEDPNAWGNLIGFRDDPGFWSITQALKRSMEYFEPKAEASTIVHSKKGKDSGFKELQAARKRIRFLEQQLSDVFDSNSWKVTAPLRAASTATRRAYRRLRRP